jgi:hypothetical protein
VLYLKNKETNRPKTIGLHEGCHPLL